MRCASPLTSGETSRLGGFWLGLGPLVLVVIAAPWIALGLPRDPDETRYLEIPREMLETGDWLTPQLNYIPYLEKPPLYYWMVAGAFKALGVGVVPARLVSLACGAGLVLMTSILGSRLWGRRAGIRAGLLLATCPFVVALSSIITVDMPFAFWVTGAITLFVIGTLDGDSGAQGGIKQTAVFLLGYAFLGLAVLTKGPVALLFPGLVWLFWPGRSRQRFLPPKLLPGSVILCAVAAPWFVLIAWNTPQFLEFFFVTGHVSRLISATDTSEISFHAQPFYAYLPVLAGGAFPWILWLSLPRRRLREEMEPGSASRMAWSWVLPAFLLLSIIPAKLPTYVLPLFPPIALLAASRWEEALSGKLSQRFHSAIAAVLASVVLVCISVFWWVLLTRGGKDSMEDIDRPVAALASCFAATAAFGAAYLLWSARLLQAFWVTFAMSCGVAVLGAVLKVPLDREESLSGMMTALIEVRRPDEPVVCERRFLPAVPFYLQGPAFVYGGRGELAFGSETLGRRPDLFPSPERIAHWSNGPGRIFFTVPERRLSRLEKELGVDLHVLERRGNVLLVSNHAQPWKARTASETRAGRPAE